MTDIFLYQGEASPADVKLRDPTSGGGGSTIVLSPTEGALSLAGQIASITLIIAAVAGSLVLGGNAPALNQQLVPATGVLVLSGQSPALSQQLVPTAASVVKTGNAPALAGQLVPTSGSLVLSGSAPAIQLQFAPSSGAVVKGGSAPALQLGLAPGSGALLINGWAPSLSGGGGTTLLSPASGSITVAGWTPQLIFWPPQQGRHSRTQFINKTPTEVAFLAADFSSLLGAGETITAANWSNSIYSGSATDAATMPSGLPVNGSVTSQQMFAGGTSGCVYLPICTVLSTAGKFYTLDGFLVVS